MPALLIFRSAIVVVAAANGALSLSVYSQESGGLGPWVLGWGIPLVFAVLAGIFRRRWAAFVYAGWSSFSAFLGFWLQLTFADPSREHLAWIGLSILWLSLIAVVMGLVVGFLLSRSASRPPA